MNVPESAKDRARELLERYDAATPSLRTLDDNTFDEVVKKASGVVVVKFFSRGCRQCHVLAPAFEQVSASGRIIYKLDCQVSTATVERLFIKSYPKILMFQHGALKSIYAGSRDANAIEEWIARRAGALQSGRD